jgi:lipopolysaccharide export system permease protein
MKILRNYILRECLLPFFISLGVLTSVFLLGYLPQLADKVINKGVSLSAVSQVFLYYIPLLLGYTLPIACLTTIILTFGRLSADNEILAIRASGIYLRRIISPLIMVGLIFSVILFILNDRVIPQAYTKQREILKDTGFSNPAALLEAGTFINAFDGYIIFIYRLEGNKMYNVRIYQPQPEGKPTRTVIAQEGEFATSPDNDTVKLKLVNGTSDEIDFKNPNNFYKLNFETSFITLDMSKTKKKFEKKPKAMTLRELRQKIDEYETLFVGAAPLWTEYHRKIAWSLTPLLFILLGFPLAVITHRREKGANLLYALLFSAPYFLISLGCQALAGQGMTPPGITMWIPNIIAAIVVGILNYRMCVK